MNNEWIALPERSTKWILYLFGSSDFTYIPLRDYEPSWLVRKMCKYLLDCNWVRVDKSE